MINVPQINILLIEDEAFDVRRIENTLEPFADRLLIREVVSNGHAALEQVEARPGFFDVVIMDYQIAGGLSGENLIRRLRNIDPLLQIVVVTKMTINITDFEFANRLLEAGAMWYCTKYPGDIEDYIYQPTDFLLSIFNAFEKKNLEIAKRRSEKKLDENVAEFLQGKVIIGDSNPIQLLKKQILQSARSEATVLIQGASGTGKELVAANIHFNSDRRFEKFVPINCGSLPAELIESELFGFEKGAFTGAHAKKPGLFEIAHKGTVFLDEVTELPLPLQVKLLRVIQEGEIDKIGRRERMAVDVRLIAATNRSIEEEVRAGRFREDLYYRLNVVRLQVPALRERPEDILPLVDHFLERYCQQMDIAVPLLSEEARDLLRRHLWQGNVRELQNVVQRLLFFREEQIDEEMVRSSFGHLHREPAVDPFQ
ncbi:MAG TPA: sigma-54 dependent transcriptional regulator, partial [Calditrichia bacterium]|nr:sigma-54 dependent transcriptional regulator [Calditrichia bacterium]